MTISLSDAAATLNGSRVILRSSIPSDVDQIAALPHDPDVQAGYGYYTTELRPRTMDQAQHWVKRHSVPAAWVIEYDHRPVGGVFLHSLVASDLRAQVAIGLLSSTLFGQGLGREALSVVIDHAFSGLGLHRLSLRVLADNVRAQNCYKSLGFQLEGRERQAANTSNGWQDDIMMGLLATEWEQET